MRKSLFWDDSKSVDYGFDPHPQIPDAVLVLSEHSDSLFKEFKSKLMISLFLLVHQNSKCMFKLPLPLKMIWNNVYCVYHRTQSGQK